MTCLACRRRGSLPVRTRPRTRRAARRRDRGRQVASLAMTTWSRPADQGQTGGTTVSEQGTASDGTIRPFRVDMPDEAIADLRRRIAATRLPSKELVADRSQGVQLATIQELARYWTTDYDWRACEARLNALPQFKTEIDGVDVHFIHVKSPHEGAL